MNVVGRRTRHALSISSGTRTPAHVLEGARVGARSMGRLEGAVPRASPGACIAKQAARCSGQWSRWHAAPPGARQRAGGAATAGELQRDSPHPDNLALTCMLCRRGSEGDQEPAQNRECLYNDLNLCQRRGGDQGHGSEGEYTHRQRESNGRWRDRRTGN